MWPPLVFIGFQNCILVCFAVWRACKGPSRVQWYPKTAPSRVQCVFFFVFFFCCRPHTRPRVSEKQKKSIPLGFPSAPACARGAKTFLKCRFLTSLGCLTLCASLRLHFFLRLLISAILSWRETRKNSFHLLLVEQCNVHVVCTPANSYLMTSSILCR